MSTSSLQLEEGPRSKREVVNESDDDTIVVWAGMRLVAVIHPGKMAAFELKRDGWVRVEPPAPRAEAAA